MKIKICGITCLDDALLAARAGADAIGLNFYPETHRRVTPDRAAEIVRALPPFVEPVGLFVNASAAEIRRIAGLVGLRCLQLHGDEPPGLLVELAEFFLIRAFRVGSDDLDALAPALDGCARAGRLPNAVLVDAHVDGKYGGTGTPVSWSTLASDYDRESWPPLILAGGLTPENVAEAIEQVRPWAVDVASGVEGDVPGRKSPERIEAFIREARAAFDRASERVGK